MTVQDIHQGSKPMPDISEERARELIETHKQGVMHIMDSTGDTKVLWSADSPDEVANAKRTFDDLRRKGFLAYTVDEEGGRGEVIREFDKTAGRIIMAPQLVGG